MMKLGLQVSGRFTIEKRIGNVITEVRSWNNLVLDSAFNRLVERLHGTDAFRIADYLFFGTGQSEPARSDTGLENRSNLSGKRIGSTSFTGWLDGVNGDRYADAILSYSFAAGEAQGVWTEIGTAGEPGYSTPFNRALIRDENGYPTPLLVAADESITVYLRLRIREALGYPIRVDLTLPDGTPIRGTVTPLDADGYTNTGTGNVWRTGFANRSMRLLNEARNTLTYPTLPWPYSPPSTNTQATVTYHHNTNMRRTRGTFTLGASTGDVEIHGIGFGPGTDFIYRLMFDEPIHKPAMDALSFDADISFFRTSTD